MVRNFCTAGSDAYCQENHGKPSTASLPSGLTAENFMEARSVKQPRLDQCTSLWNFQSDGISAVPATVGFPRPAGSMIWTCFIR
jgi:hypothetical protein